MFQTSPNQLLALGGLGLTLLWGVAFLNGMFDNLDTVLETGLLPDGRALRTVYSHNWLIDNRLTLLTAFYDLLTNSLSTGPPLLFFDVNYVVACTNVWVLVESRRRGVRNFFLRHTWVIIILWNATGAAIIQPLYFYCVSKSKAVSRDPTIPINEAISVFITTILALLCPLLLFLPSWLSYSAWDHHGFIALFHISPILVTVLFITGSTVLSYCRMSTPNKASENPNADKLWIVASYITTGTVAAAVHAFTVITSLRTSNPDVTFTRLFIPSPGRANLFRTWFPKFTSAFPGLPAKYTELLEQYHLFSQFDLVVVALSCIVFVHYLLSHSGSNKVEHHKKRIASVENRELVYLYLGTLFLGPGAAGSFALAIRESRIRRYNMLKAQ
ncbi:hypothetical protein CPC735_040330 [Coccidioides posadasii C735 delta SOWgp]|uniref:Uncharacterized protein n=1 Tax=Coccidioides posadasii (strain C735) TaxID=222929 RepID=C5P381_COCP7|nr:hypothetical protein CPC735_040330 [Coccidioides posadasii C735 delta SOWgp]EER28769.1 hypothetical protein CPC735_040330 [Coccidioides posadasii C735 delta SOWgp]|eukprot:XP_003070914.1 hypothetical protein CPC735_040330 [Coccidioides posadasii C735 delta SOWgp]